MAKHKIKEYTKIAFDGINPTVFYKGDSVELSDKQLARMIEIGAVAKSKSQEKAEAKAAKEAAKAEKEAQEKADAEAKIAAEQEAVEAQEKADAEAAAAAAAADENGDDWGGEGEEGTND